MEFPVDDDVGVAVGFCDRQWLSVRCPTGTNMRTLTLNFCLNGQSEGPAQEQHTPCPTIVTHVTGDRYNVIFGWAAPAARQAASAANRHRPPSLAARWTAVAGGSEPRPTTLPTLRLRLTGDRDKRAQHKASNKLVDLDVPSEKAKTEIAKMRFTPLSYSKLTVKQFETHWMRVFG